MNQRLIVVALLVTLTLAGCMQIRVPPAETDPDPEPTPEPPTATITVTIPTSSIVLDAAGESAITKVTLRYRALLAALQDSEPETPEWTEAVLAAGTDASLELAGGQYEFQASAYSAAEELLAFGSMQLAVSGQTTEANLALQPLLGSVQLSGPPELHSAEVSSQLSLRLRVSSPWGTYEVAPDYYTLHSEVSNGTIINSGNGVIDVLVHEDAVGELSVSAQVSGLLEREGALVPGTLTAEYTVAVVGKDPDPGPPEEEPDPDTGPPEEEPDPDTGPPEEEPDPDTGPPVEEPNPDFVPPALEFDPLTSDGFITGTVTDNSGLPALAVYEGPTLLGSLQGGQVTVSEQADGWSWQMPWSPGTGDHVLRVVATDAAQNSSSRFQAWFVSDPDVAPGDITTYRTVSGTIDGSDETLEDTGYCPVNELVTPGQGLQAVGAGLQAVGAGLQAVGAVGGMFLADTANFGNSLVTVETVAAELAFKATGNAGYAVILLVDDFGANDVHELPAAVVAGTITAQELNGLAGSDALSHGALVLHHTRMMLAALGYADSGAAAAEVWRNGNRGIELVPVNIHGLSTMPAAAGGTIQDVMSAAVVQHGQRGQLVVNMSFVILPCSVQDDLQASGINTFEDYLLALAAVNGIEPGAAYEMEWQLLNAGNDPLLAYFECPVRDGNGDCDMAGVLFDGLVHVGAAGNYGSDFPLFPAAADNVVSVSSVDAVAAGSYSTQRSAFSNLGGVMTPGAMFELASSGGRTVAYAGTSFAAPVVTVFTALDLMHDPRTCYPGGLAQGGMMMGPPELAHPDLESDPRPLLRAYGDGFRSAIDDVCTDETTY